MPVSGIYIRNSALTAIRYKKKKKKMLWCFQPNDTPPQIYRVQLYHLGRQWSRVTTAAVPKVIRHFRVNLWSIIVIGFNYSTRFLSVRFSYHYWYICIKITSVCLWDIPSVSWDLGFRFGNVKCSQWIIFVFIIFRRINCSFVLLFRTCVILYLNKILNISRRVGPMFIIINSILFLYFCLMMMTNYINYLI